MNIIGKSEHAQLRGKMRKLAAGETLFGNEYTLLSKDARLIPVLAYSSPVLTGQQVTGGRTVLIDISDRKAAEQVLERYARRMEMLHQIDRSILSSHSAEEIAQAALNGIKKMVPIPVAAYLPGRYRFRPRPHPGPGWRLRPRRLSAPRCPNQHRLGPGRLQATARRRPSGRVPAGSARTNL